MGIPITRAVRLHVLIAMGLAVLAAPVIAAVDPEVAAIVSQVSQASYTTTQVAIESMGLGLYGGAGYNQGYRDRNGSATLGSLGNQEARLYLSDSFTAMGLNVTIQGTYRNVVGELVGKTTPDDVYIVCGHYDHTGGSLGAEKPGGDDNASGTAGVLEAARVLSQYDFGATIRFIGFNAEEDGLLGSKNYVSNVVVSGAENVVGVINLDMILRPGSDGDPTGHPIDLQLGTRTGDVRMTDWAKIFQDAAADYVPSLTVESTIHNLTWGSDQEPFASAGYPAFLAIDNFSLSSVNDYYHTSDDASDRLANDPLSPSGVTYDYAFATDTVRVTVATIADQAGVVPEPATLSLMAVSLTVLLRRRRR